MNKVWKEKLSGHLYFDEGQDNEETILSRLAKDLPAFMDEYALAVLNDRELQRELLKEKIDKF